MNPLDISKIEAIRDAARAADPDDEQLLLDMIEGETNAEELMDRLIDNLADAEEVAAAIKERMQKLAQRLKRYEARQRSIKAAMLALLNAAGLKKMERPEATVSKRGTPPAVEIVDADAVPTQLCVVVRRPDKKAIAAAIRQGEQVPGAILTKPGETVSVRRA